MMDYRIRVETYESGKMYFPQCRKKGHLKWWDNIEIDGLVRDYVGTNDIAKAKKAVDKHKRNNIPDKLLKTEYIDC